MSFTTTVKIAGGKTEKIELPNLTTKFGLIPETLKIEQTVNGQKCPAKSVDLVVTTGNTQLFQASRALFDITNVVDLTCKKDSLGEGKPVSLSIANRNREPSTFTINVDYVSHQGNLIFQNHYDTFDNVLQEVFSAGQITRLVFVFKWKVSNVKLIPTFSHDSSVEWINGLELGDSDENGVYAIDFTESSDLALYSQYLNFMKLDIPKEFMSRGENGEELLTLSVVSYGYSN